MSRDYDELGYLADLNDPENEDFIPADYNTQDMRNINEKVNRILYGDDSYSYKKSADKKVDISKGASSYVSPRKISEIHSYSSSEVKEAVDEEAKDFIMDVKKNPYDARREAALKAKMEKDKKGRISKKKKITIISIVATAIVLCAVLVLVVQAVVMPKDNLLSDMGFIEKVTDPVVITNKDGDFVFAKGCKVSGVDISGMTVKEAKSALKEKELEARPPIDIKVTVDGEENKYTEDNFTFTYNTDDILKAEKEFSEKLAVGTTFPVAEDKNGEEYFPEAVREINAVINDSSVKKLVSKINKKYDVKTRDAKVSKFDPSANDMFTFKEGKSGKNLDAKSLQKKFNTIINSGKKDGNYKGGIIENTETVKPKVSVSYLKKNMVLLAEWTTISTNDASGNQNMDVSLKACNGSVINPGDVWSFNDCTGDSNNPENGYAQAGVIVNGSYTNGYGGGICQSSTTIYNAAVRSNLEIYERHNHTYPSVYAYSGFDAAIDYGNFDLKLKNNSKYQVFLECYMSGTTLYARFYGIKTGDYDYIDTFSENYEIASSYYKARSYRIYKDSSGNEIDREDLPESYYSLENGHSVQTADAGGQSYEHNKRVYSDGEVAEEREKETQPPVTQAPATQPPQTEAPTQAPTQAPTKPPQTEAPTEAPTKPPKTEAQTQAAETVTENTIPLEN